MADDDTPSNKDALRDEDPVQLGRDAVGTAGLGDPPGFWLGRVGPGENVLWWGAPDMSRVDATVPRSPVLLSLYAFGLALGLGLLIRGSGGFTEKALGMAVVVFASLQIARALKAGRRQISATHYLLTDRAAYLGIFRADGKPSIQRHEITPEIPVRGGADFVTLEVGRRRRGRDRDAEPIMFGFRNIAEGPHVLALIRDIQKAKK